MNASAMCPCGCGKARAEAVREVMRRCLVNEDQAEAWLDETERQQRAHPGRTA